MSRAIRIVPTPSVPSRALEWHCALTTLLGGLILALPGASFDLSVVYQRLEELMPEETWAVIVTGVGLIRVAALMINGHWRRTPILRAATAAIGAGFWGYATTLFIVPGQPVPWGIAWVGMLCVSEIHNAMRAGSDIELVRHLVGVMDDPNTQPAPTPWIPAP